MLNLTIAMKRFLLIIWLIFAFLPQPVHAQEGDQVTISSPEEGQFVQGIAIVTGSVTATGFSSYELSFAYNDDPTQTWFVLTSGSSPVYDGQLGTWDTSTLTDGDYALRLRVFLLDGSQQEVTVTGLRVRNYTPIPTATFTPTVTPVVKFAAPTAQRIALAAVTATPSMPTPTPMPPNPASLAERSIPGALGRGAALALGLFVILGLLLRLRRE
jgi:hypothetical protein